MKHALLALILCLPVIAAAQSDSRMRLGQTGSDYLRICEAGIHGETNSHDFECVLWLTGVLDGFTAYGIAFDLVLYDTPAGITTGQIEKIVVKYMNDHPKDLNLPASVLVLGALKDAYPPKKK